MTGHSGGDRPLTAWYRSVPDLTQQIIATHLRDRWGGCVVCSGHRPVSYPCALVWHAAEALSIDPGNIDPGAVKPRADPPPPWPDGKFHWKRAT